MPGKGPTHDETAKQGVERLAGDLWWRWMIALITSTVGVTGGAVGGLLGGKVAAAFGAVLGGAVGLALSFGILAVIAIRQQRDACRAAVSAVALEDLRGHESALSAAVDEIGPTRKRVTTRYYGVVPEDMQHVMSWCDDAILALREAGATAAADLADKYVAPVREHVARGQVYAGDDKLFQAAVEQINVLVCRQLEAVRRHIRRAEASGRKV